MSCKTYNLQCMTQWQTDCLHQRVFFVRRRRCLVHSCKKTEKAEETPLPLARKTTPHHVNRDETRQAKESKKGQMDIAKKQKGIKI